MQAIKNKHTDIEYVAHGLTTVTGKGSMTPRRHHLAMAILPQPPQCRTNCHGKLAMRQLAMPPPPPAYPFAGGSHQPWRHNGPHLRIQVQPSMGMAGRLGWSMAAPHGCLWCHHRCTHKRHILPAAHLLGKPSAQAAFGHSLGSSREDAVHASFSIVLLTHERCVLPISFSPWVLLGGWHPCQSWYCGPLLWHATLDPPFIGGFASLLRRLPRLTF